MHYLLEKKFIFPGFFQIMLFLLALFAEFSVTAERPVFIVDFDDTIFPTFHLVRLGASVPERDLVALTFQVQAFVERLDAMGEVVILTASSPGWVPATIGRVFPRLIGLFEGKRVVYSRQTLDELAARDPVLVRDKSKSFSEVLGELNPSDVRVVVSFSDAVSDIDSFAEACLRFDRLACRSVQFKADPLLNELAQQLELVRDMLDFIVSSYPTTKIVPYAIGKVKDQVKLLRGPLNRVRHLPSDLPSELRSVTRDSSAGAAELQSAP